MIKENNGKFTVKVYDRGFVDMVELINGEWKVCEFDTEEEAKNALDNYNEYRENRI